MHWQSQWIQDITPNTMGVMEHLKQSLNFMGAGVNYVW
jgi:hypothetical protein